MCPSTQGDVREMWAGRGALADPPAGGWRSRGARGQWFPAERKQRACSEPMVCLPVSHGGGRRVGAVLPRAHRGAGTTAPLPRASWMSFLVAFVPRATFKRFGAHVSNARHVSYVVSFTADVYGLALTLMVRMLTEAGSKRKSPLWSVSDAEHGGSRLAGSPWGGLMGHDFCARSLGHPT